MKQCPVCKRELKEHLLYCPFDGQALISKTEQDKMVGVVLDDKYRLEKKIGEGGMGKVYRATHIHMDSTVAIKVLHPHLSSDQTALERFRREARAAAYIRHPNAIAVTDFGVTRDTDLAYLVMEFLEGVDLRQKIKKETQLDYEESFLIVQQTCSALQVAHTKGIIHRDLKPDNIWLIKSEDGIDRVKVLDFGIAKLKTSAETSNLTQQGTIVGTPYYMSPEQCRGEELDARSDVYSLGVIIYEMLTGQVPFQASTPVGVVLKHANEPPPSPRNLRNDIPQPVEDVILRALNKKREDRQDSAMHLSQEFESALFAAGLELKLLGTSTPPSPFSMTHSSVPYKTHSISDASAARSETTASVPADISQSGRPLTNSGDPALSKPPSFSSSTPFGVAVPERNTRLYMIIGVAAVVLISIIVAIIALSGGKETTPDQPPGPPPTVPIPTGMVRVKGGTFSMGTDNQDAEPYLKPAHSMTVADFFLDENEVTNQEYQQFVKEKGHPAPPHWRNGEFPPGEANLPVWNVSWRDAKAYAEWAGKRLPTETEWEYAARGPDNRKYPWGNEWSARFSNSKEDNRVKPVAVGSYPSGKSWCGINDMAGNVAEWVEDEYAPYPGSSAPPDPGNKIYRGGAYNLRKNELITWARYADKPDRKEPYIGFRCAKDVPK